MPGRRPVPKPPQSTKARTVLAVLCNQVVDKAQTAFLSDGEGRLAAGVLLIQALVPNDADGLLDGLIQLTASIRSQG